LNGFSYVEGNPVNYVDPSGHCLWALSSFALDGGTAYRNCGMDTWNRTIESYQGGERRPLILASHASGVSHLLIEQSETLDQLNTDAAIVFSNACFEDRILPSVRLGLWGTETAVKIVPVGQAIKTGVEFPFGNNFRIAPFGNRTGHPTGSYPHYHRRGVNPITGETYRGQSIRRHRPWDTRATDTCFWERF
jgi:hypothetical protein